jgi:hypothetical protein
MTTSDTSNLSRHGREQVGGLRGDEACVATYASLMQQRWKRQCRYRREKRERRQALISDFA